MSTLFRCGLVEWVEIKYIARLLLKWDWADFGKFDIQNVNVITFYLKKNRAQEESPPLSPLSQI